MLDGLRVQRDAMALLLKDRGFKRRLRWFALRGREYRRGKEVVILSVVNEESFWSYTGNGFAFGIGYASLQQKLNPRSEPHQVSDPNTPEAQAYSKEYWEKRSKIEPKR
jgi:hypothetical protein